MSFPLKNITKIPPSTPIKRRSIISSSSVPHFKIKQLISEGSYYKVYLTENSTILRVAKRDAGDKLEIEILQHLDHPHINKMICWWIDENKLVFEMEACDMNLTEAEDILNNKKKDKNIKVNELELSLVNKYNSFIVSDDTPNKYTTDNKTYEADNNISQIQNNLDSHNLIDPFTDTEYNTSTIISETSSTEEELKMDGNGICHNIPDWVTTMMMQISSALSYLHRNSIIHMDVKAENILVKFNEDKVTFQLCDFNISRYKEGMVDLDGDKVYMAPEILRNRCYYTSDVYSLGLLYLQLLNECELPSTGEDYCKLRRNDFTGWNINEVCRNMLEKDPHLRCSAEEVERYFSN